MVTDYGERTFQFSYQGTNNISKGLEKTSVKPIQLHSLGRDTTTSAISSYYCLQIVSTVPTHDEQVSPNLHAILESFAHVFQRPQCMPPSQTHDYTIHLTPRT